MERIDVGDDVMAVSVSSSAALVTGEIAVITMTDDTGATREALVGSGLVATEALDLGLEIAVGSARFSTRVIQFYPPSWPAYLRLGTTALVVVDPRRPLDVVVVDPTRPPVPDPLPALLDQAKALT